ncbi:MAG: hypothetical protein KDB03_08515 [Planctomycetales bacterium]|nr:hypothetical protein [Planctomycetales bacterium]
MIVRRFFCQILLITTIALLHQSSNVHAALVSLNVNSAASSITLSGEVGGAAPGGGVPYAQQTAGSLVTNWGGTIQADLTGGVFTFAPGGSSITAQINPNGPFTTAPNPIGTEAGNYGVTATGPIQVAGGAVLTINGVYKDLVLDIISGTAQNGVALTGATMNFSAGALDFGVSALAPSGTSSLVGINGLNTSASFVTWDGTTLTIPVTFQTTGGSGRIENWNGTIVAAVPEPSSIGIISILGLVVTGYRARRK